MKFIYDRTEDDVYEAKRFEQMDWDDFSDEEKEQWFAGLKGSFNYTDYNRIVNNIKDLCVLKDYTSREPLLWTLGYNNGVISNINSSYVSIINPNEHNLVITLYPTLNATVPTKVINSNEKAIVIQSVDQNCDSYYAFQRIGLSTNVTPEVANADIIVNATDSVTTPSFTLNKMEMADFFRYAYIKDIVDNINTYLKNFAGTDSIVMEKANDFEFFNRIEYILYLAYDKIVSEYETYTSITWLNASKVLSTETGELLDRALNVIPIEAGSNNNYYIHGYKYVEIRNFTMKILSITSVSPGGTILSTYFDDEYKQMEIEPTYNYYVGYVASITDTFDFNLSHNAYYITPQTDITNDVYILNPEEKEFYYYAVKEDGTNESVGPINDKYLKIPKSNIASISVRIMTTNIDINKFKVYEGVTLDLNIENISKVYANYENPRYTLVAFDASPSPTVSSPNGWSYVENPGNSYSIQTIYNSVADDEIKSTDIETLKLTNDEVLYVITGGINARRPVLKESQYAYNCISSNFLDVPKNSVIKINAPQNIKVKVLMYTSVIGNAPIYNGFTEKFGGTTYIDTSTANFSYKIVLEAKQGENIVDNVEILIKK